jgi:23S rRNA pseudouridine1911/1915/1917 synthase
MATASFQVGASSARLVDVARQHLVVLSIDRVGPAIAGGAITVNGRPGAIHQIVSIGDELAVAGALADPLVPEPAPLAVIREDDDLLIVDKPAGVHVHPLGAHRAGTLLNALLWHAGARPAQPWAAWRPRPAHRLDRGASGLLVIAKRAEIHDALRAMFEAHTVARRYRATVHGRIAADAGTIDAPLGRDPANDYRRAVVSGGQRAITHYRVVRRAPATTVIELELATGRTHQIRAHLASLGHPIAGDTLYGGSPDAAPWTIALRAVALHLRHPRDGRPIAVELPDDDAADDTNDAAAAHDTNDADVTAAD